MNFLLFGKTGQLGWELQRTISPLGDLHAFGRNDLDLTHLDTLACIIRKLRPRVIVNASAYTAVDQAETESELATKVNADAPRVMAEEARALDALLVHYSTDYVFDGKKKTPYHENDVPNPLGIYGKSKLAGEQAIKQTGCVHIILRTSWVYNLWGGGFVSKVLSWSRKQEIMRIVADQVGSPTWSRMLAEVSALMLGSGKSTPHTFFAERTGIYHLGGSGSVSRFDFARRILELDPQADRQIVKHLEPAKTVDFPTPAVRPLYTSLDCSRFETTFGLRMPPWDECLSLAINSLEDPV